MPLALKKLLEKQLCCAQFFILHKQNKKSLSRAKTTHGTKYAERVFEENDSEAERKNAFAFFLFAIYCKRRSICGA